MGLFLGLMGTRTPASQSTKANIDTPVVAACSVQVEGCDQPSLDGSRQFLISHHVLSGGCSTRDLHVIRYGTELDAQPLVAIWCS